MTKKNSLTAFKKSVAPILPSSDGVKTSMPIKGKVGRPRSKEKRTHKVMLSFTPDEGKKSRSRAGEANEATHIYNFLRDNGYFK